MGLIGKSLQSGFGREIGKNTGKVVSNAIFGNKHSTPYSHTIKKTKKQLEQDAIEKEEAHQKKLELEQEKADAKLQLEREKHQQKMELEQLKQQEKAKKEKAKMAVEIEKHKKNIVGELKKLKGLLDEELLSQAEYMFLKERLMKYL
jgi:hypothetical protein